MDGDQNQNGKYPRRYFSLFRETPNQKKGHSSIPYSELSAIVWQNGSLLNNTINKNIQDSISFHYIKTINLWTIVDSLSS